MGACYYYVRTTDDKQPDHHYQLNGNQISVVTLDLNQEFERIKLELLTHTKLYFQSE